MKTLLDQIAEQKQLAAQRRAATASKYSDILDRHAKPQPHDAERLLELMAELGVTEADLAAHLDAHRKSAELWPVAFAGEGATRERPAVEAALQKLLAGKAAAVATWDKKINPVAAKLQEIDQQIHVGQQARDRISEIEVGIAFGKVPSAPPPPAPETKAEILRDAGTDAVEQSRFYATMPAEDRAAFEALRPAQQSAWWGELPDDRYLAVKRAVEKGWLTSKVPPPPREIKPPPRSAERQVFDALRSAPPGVVSASIVRAVDPRDALHNRQ